MIHTEALPKLTAIKPQGKMEEEVMGVEANATKERWVNKQGEEDTAEKASTVSGGGVSNASLLSTSACRVAEKIVKPSLILSSMRYIFLRCQNIKIR